MSTEFKKFLSKLDKFMDETQATPQWWYVVHISGRYMKVTTWATEERAQEIANNQEKPSRVVPYNGRFAVQYWG